MVNGMPDQRPVRGIDAVRHIGIEHVGVPAESRLRQQSRGVCARRAARAQPAERMAPGGAAQDLDTSGNIAAFGVLGQIRRQRSLAPAMRRHHMPARSDRRRKSGISLGDHAAGVEHRPRVLAIQQIEQPPHADLRAVLRPGQRLKIGHARLQRIAHRADAGRAALGPALQHHAERYRQWPTQRASRMAARSRPCRPHQEHNPHSGDLHLISSLGEFRRRM